MPAIILSEYTNKLIDLAVKMAKVAAENDKQYFIGGGLAIDLSIGRITRDHHDIDFHPMLVDGLWWKEWFEGQGYVVKDQVDLNFTEVFKVKDKDDNSIVDMWPFKLDKGTLLIKYKGKYVDAGRHWEEIRMVVFRGTRIYIENPERVLEQKIRHEKMGQAFRPEDRHDFRLLGRSLKG